VEARWASAGVGMPFLRKVSHSINVVQYLLTSSIFFAILVLAILSMNGGHRLPVPPLRQANDCHAMVTWQWIYEKGEHAA